MLPRLSTAGRLAAATLASAVAWGCATAPSSTLARDIAAAEAAGRAEARAGDSTRRADAPSPTMMAPGTAPTPTAGAAVSTAPRAPSAPSAMPAMAAAVPAAIRMVRVGHVTGFRTPESVKYDPEQDVYFVANIDGSPNAKDNNGFISRVTPDGKIDRLRFAVGTAAAPLHAPKGMAIVADTLWIADIDALRAYNRRTGARIRSVSLAALGAVFLNDIAVGPDGALYITDTGIRFGAGGSMTQPGPDRIFRVMGTARAAALTLPPRTAPNGIAWDQAGGRFVIVPFGGGQLLGWAPGAAAAQPIGQGPGQYDGVVVMGDGRLLVSSWASSAVHLFGGLVAMGSMANGGGVVVGDVPAPADIDVDTKRRRILVPLFNENRVEMYEMP